MNRDERCKEALEAPLPDVGQEFGMKVILQCQRKLGHKGVHRFHEQVTWSGTFTTETEKG